MFLVDGSDARLDDLRMASKQWFSSFARSLGGSWAVFDSLGVCRFSILLGKESFAEEVDHRQWVEGGEFLVIAVPCGSQNAVRHASVFFDGAKGLPRR